MLSSLVQNYARKLNQLLGMVAHETKNLQTVMHKKGVRCWPIRYGERTQGESGAHLALLLEPQAYRQLLAAALIVL